MKEEVTPSKRMVSAAKAANELAKRIRISKTRINEIEI